MWWDNESFSTVDFTHFDDAKPLKLNLMQQNIHSRGEWISSARPENPRIVPLHIGHDRDMFKMCWTLWGRIFFAAVIDFWREASYIEREHPRLSPILLPYHLPSFDGFPIVNRNQSPLPVTDCIAAALTQ